jgi:hypothetical protein
MNITNSPQFSYQTAAPAPVKRTLNDYRINPVDYAALAASKTNSVVSPGWIVALAIAMIGAGAFAVNQRGGFVGKHEAVAPAASIQQTVPAASSVIEPAVAPATAETTARDTAASAPLAPLTKSSETTEMPKALHGNNHSSESVQPAPAPKKVNSSSAKPAPAKKVAEPLVAPPPVNNQVTPPVEAAPPAPTPPVVEPTPSAPPSPTPEPKPQ